MKPLSKKFRKAAGLVLLNTALLFTASNFLTSCSNPEGGDTGGSTTTAPTTTPTGGDGTGTTTTTTTGGDGTGTTTTTTGGDGTGTTTTDPATPTDDKVITLTTKFNTASSTELSPNYVCPGSAYGSNGETFTVYQFAGRNFKEGYTYNYTMSTSDIKSGDCGVVIYVYSGLPKDSTFNIKNAAFSADSGPSSCSIIVDVPCNLVKDSPYSGYVFKYNPVAPYSSGTLVGVATTANNEIPFIAAPVNSKTYINGKSSTYSDRYCYPK